ncbi:TonB-dependent receptor [Pedobacter sp. MC2016-14]|uniref:TonB-dependent receptor n=1 Tax=Pedobacter sp. MC2016-14 TaxID=2897327 RepID=UPI001E5205BD|nr:TonB-dependent receptor [Pedobacter sp. MC2016-14]MCD0490516.1 TonB-dependent receptor [Pedobacter sp. MC2016-14]
MKIFYILLILSISFITSATAQTKGGLSGRVYDGQGKPLSGATIRLEPDRLMMQSNNRGAFLFKDIYTGDYTIYVSSVGFKSYKKAVLISPDQINTIDIRLEAGQGDLNEVVVAEKRENPDNLIRAERSAMPVTVITRRSIELMGSRRLDEVLKEQTGIAMVNDIGSGSRAVGIQMQGFSSQYVMVLVDGQPMVGRNNGNLDLSRISVNNVERIEIIKGATSCLYGSEALGGAINVITRFGAVQPQARAALFYGSRNLMDGTLEAEMPFQGQRGSVLLSGNYYATEGYNTNKTYLVNSQTLPPFKNYSGQARIKYQLNGSTNLGFQARYNKRTSRMEMNFASSGITNGNLNELDDEDLNLTLNLRKNFKNKMRSQTNYYFTNYATDMLLSRAQRAEVLASSKFDENTHRIEEQLAFAVNNELKFTGGLGGTAQQMNNSEFEESLYTAFGYVQGDWMIAPKWSAVGGLRYDHTSSFGGRLNPSFGLQYQLLPTLSIKAGLGGGFIAPDFKKRFQIFTNITQGYTVIGSDIIKDGLEELQNAGEVSEIRSNVLNQLSASLRPERSNSYNAGLVFTPGKSIKIEGSAFYHRLYDFINFVQVGTKTNGQQIFSYTNVAESTNKGFELSASINLVKNLTANLGYQYLVMKDQGIVELIKQGVAPYNKVRNSITGETRAAVPADYFGLDNRSKHMLNANFTYQTAWGITSTLRANYRGKYGWADDNNNLFIDPYDIFVKGFVLVYASVEKRMLKDKLSITLSGENLFDYTDPLMPGQMGRTLLAGITWRIFKN